MNKGRVLIIEDDRLQAMVEERMLKKLDYDVIGIHTSAEEGYLAIKDLKPDIVLMDNRLKGEMEGFELVKKLRSEQDNTPVIFVTGESDKEQKTMAGNLNIIYLVKPVMLDALIYALDQIRGSARQNAINSLS